jgi:cytidylate kinase
VSLIVTIDGPGGTGKSTVARAVALAAGLPHLDTGAFYRAATLAVLREGVDPADQKTVAEVVAGSQFDQEAGAMYLDGEDVSTQIRSAAVTTSVSEVAAQPEVRRLLVEHQRDWVTRHGGRAIVEGRDIGSVVFPSAELKVYLDARPEVRAARRARESGTATPEVVDALERRDRIDSTRAVSPLTVPDGARVIDTSDMSFDEVVEAVLGMLADLA